MADPIDESLVNADRAFQVAWIVYINGIECPAISVSVAYGVWQIPECEVTLIPDPVLQRLGAEDRVAVQVFYCDYWQRPDEPTFRLMFDGEIVSWNYVNVQRARALSFTCIDYIQIFTQTFFFFMSNVDDIATGASAQQIGVGINTVNTPGFGALYPYSLFSEGLISVQGEGNGGAGLGAPTIKRPIDFVYNVVRGLIQTTAPNRSVPAVNFFAPWTERTHFHRRFIALPLLERSEDTDAGLFPILRAVRADFGLSAVARLASSIGSSGSIWDMLQQILMTMMMEINMLPTASAVRIDGYPTNNARGLEPNGPPDIVNGLPVSSQGLEPLVLTNYFVKPQFLFGIPPSCNVFYPSQIKHFAYEENYITQPTRMYFNEESWTSYLNTSASVDPGLRNMLRDALAVAHPEEVHIAARNAINNPGENNKNVLVYPEEFFKGPVVARRPMPRWFAFLEESAAGTRDGENTPAPVTETAPPLVRNTASSPIGRGASSRRRLGRQSIADLSRPATAQEIQLARQARIPVDILRAVRHVESGSSPTATRFMPHIFHRGTNPPGSGARTRRERTRAGVFNGDSRLPAEGSRASTDAAFSLPAKEGVTTDQIKIAAVAATSWGLYQVHFNLERVFSDRSPAQQIAAFDANPVDVSEQLLVSFFLNKRTARNAARARNTSDLALYYNGSRTRPWRGNLERALVHIPLDPDFPVGGDAVPPPAVSETETVPATPPAAQEQEMGQVGGEATGQATGQVGQTDVPHGDPDRNVYRMYAKYEYYKERYARRTGGVQLLFNPYPVPGFPCAVFDRRSTQIDVFGYIMNVRQNLHSQGWTTQVSFSYGRTFQEVFALMNRQFSMENETIVQQRAETRAAVIEGNQSRLTNIGARIGAVAMAPPEPISEVRDVIQNFTRAEAFYRSLFFRTAAPAAAQLDQDQLRAESDRTESPPEDSEDVAPSQIIAPPTQSARIGLSSAADQEVARDLQNRDAAFLYPNIIEYVDNQGLRTGLQLEGIDSSARNRIIGIVGNMRIGDANEIDLDFVRRSINRPDLQQRVKGQEPDPDVTATLDAIEIEIRNAQVRSNITGDQTIIPKPEALHLFNSYESAMRNSARPICTLDEYVAFLGEDGIREGTVTPETSLLQGDSRTFPATYYIRIRSYRPGPPPNVPTTDITNTEVITSVDGINDNSTQAGVRADETARVARIAIDSGAVQGLPTDFPENRANWSLILLAYRLNALTRLAPRT